jgi:hypothetical protein
MRSFYLVGHQIKTRSTNLFFAISENNPAANAIEHLVNTTSGGTHAGGPTWFIA